MYYLYCCKNGRHSGTHRRIISMLEAKGFSNHRPSHYSCFLSVLYCSFVVDVVVLLKLVLSIPCLTELSDVSTSVLLIVSDRRWECRKCPLTRSNKPFRDDHCSRVRGLTKKSSTAISAVSREMIKEIWERFLLVFVFALLLTLTGYKAEDRIAMIKFLWGSSAIPVHVCSLPPVSLLNAFFKNEHA